MSRAIFLTLVTTCVGMKSLITLALCTSLIKIRGCIDKEPRVYRDAMTSNPWTWLVDVHPRVVIGIFNDIPNIEVESFGQ